MVDNRLNTLRIFNAFFVSQLSIFIVFSRENKMHHTNTTSYTALIINS